MEVPVQSYARECRPLPLSEGEPPHSSDDTTSTSSPIGWVRVSAVWGGVGGASFLDSIICMVTED